MKDEITRREFFKAGTVAAVASGIVVQEASAEKAAVGGLKYEAEVPETLDLAERAEFALNALTRVPDPEYHYETPMTVHLDHRPPYMSHRVGGGGHPKIVQALPMMRIMSGSTFNADVDLKTIEAVTKDVDPDGLWWLKVEGHPGRVTFAADQVRPKSQARFILALLDRYRLDHDPGWIKLAERMANGLSKIALASGDRAWYYPAYTRSGWYELPPLVETAGVQEPASSTLEPRNVGLFEHMGPSLRALADWYALSGDTRVLDVTHRLARFMLKPAMWKTSEGPTMAVAAERGIWEGHFHTRTLGMMGLLEYGIVTNNARVKEFVASSYEWGRNFGIARIGFFPAVIGPLNPTEKAYQYGGRPQGKGQVDEGCAVADMTWLAVTLSEAGVGDYWDDVDQCVRNHLVEHQMIRRDLLEEIIALGPEHKIDPRMETDKNVLERNIGSFASGCDPTMLYAWWTVCCFGNCSAALYKAWSSIVRYHDGIAQVNLLLNRASPWLDVDSYLPFEGKVVLKNKTARKALVRIPRWADKKAVRCQVNQKALSPQWLNNYLIIDGLAPKDVVTIEFPVVEAVERCTDLTYGQEYTCRFKGNTLVDISPRAERPSWTQMGSDDGASFPVRKGYPIYRRDFYKRDKAPTKKVRRYVSAALI